MPALGRLTGRGGTANLEVVLKTKPDLILDFGSVRDTYVSLADNVQEQTKIAYVLIDGRFEATPAALRLLGDILGLTTRGDELAKYVEDTFAEIDKALAATPADKRPRVYLARGPDGLETGVVGSINTEIIERAGGRNVAEAAGQRGLVRASMEQVIVADPEIILTWDRNFFDRVEERPAVGRRARRARAARLSGPYGALRLGRPAAVAQPRHRAEVARRAVLPGEIPARPSRNHPGVLSSVLSRGPKRARAGHPDRMVEGTSTERTTLAALSGYRLGVLGGLALLLAALMLAAALVGAYPLSLGEMLAAVGRRLTGAPPQGQIDTVLFEVRLPRVLAAVVVGAAIAAAGAAYQTLFRNPLVSPDILGVSTGAGLGAVLGIFLSLPVAGIQLSAFVIGLATVGLVYGIASMVHGRDPILVLVLAGVVVGSLAGAAISLMKILADPYDQLPAIVFWLLGSLSAIRKGEVWAAVPLVLIGLVPLVLLRWRINVLSLGDEEAKALGVEAGRLRLFVIAAATLMTASVVAISGVIGWVGLVIPHIARMAVGPSFDRLLPTAMLMGASYLLLVDTLARTMARIEVPIGILTAIIGAPFFLWLLAKGREGWS